MIKLYVDQIAKDTTSIFGGTKNYRKILHNIKSIDHKSLNFLLDELGEHNNASFIEAIGKFICLVQLTIDENKYLMTFCDFSKDYNKAVKYADALDDKELGRKVISCYEQTKTNKNDFVLTDEPLT